MHAADIGPVPAEQRTQSAFDLFLIFAGANTVATTLMVGASLVGGFTIRQALTLIVVGVVGGSALVAALAPLGPRLGVPSIIAARAAVGVRGGALLALLLYTTNFAWIAVNNVVGASAAARAFGGPGSERLWALALGLVATAVVAGGPRAVRWAARIGVPLMALAGVSLALHILRIGPEASAGFGTGGLGWLRGLDVVIAYQVSWILMFADYSRYTASAPRAALAVFLGLALTSLWLMPVGALAAAVTGSSDPGAMFWNMGLGVPGVGLLTVATITTNFVNIYLSALAWKSLMPRMGEQLSVWSVGLIGTGLGLASRAWLDSYVDFMLVLGGLLVPAGGILIGRFFVLRDAVDIEALYDPRGRYAGFSGAGLVAWALGSLTYFAADSMGGTVPALATAILVYYLLARRRTSAPA